MNGGSQPTHLSFSQGAYEDFVKDTNASINEKNLDITNKSETKAQAEADKSEADAALEVGKSYSQWARGS